MEYLTNLDCGGGGDGGCEELSFTHFKYLEDSSYHHRYLKFDFDDANVFAYIIPHYSRIIPSFLIHSITFVFLIIIFPPHFTLNPSLTLIKQRQGI